MSFSARRKSPPVPPFAKGGRFKRPKPRQQWHPADHQPIKETELKDGSLIQISDFPLSLPGWQAGYRAMACIAWMTTSKEYRLRPKKRRIIEAHQPVDLSARVLPAIWWSSTTAPHLNAWDLSFPEQQVNDRL